MVVDELLVVLGLDARQFNEEQRRAIESFRKTQQAAGEFSKNVERNGAKLSEVFRVLRGGALGIAAAFGAGEVANFVLHISNMDAATGRFAKTIGTTVEGLSKWNNIAQLYTGKEGAATSVLTSIQQVMENARQSGGDLGEFGTLLMRAGSSIRDDPDTVLRKIRGWITTEVGAGRMSPSEAATWLRRTPGMNEDMVGVLTLANENFKRLSDSADKAGAANRKSAEAGAYLVEKFNQLSLAITDFGRIILRVAEFGVRLGTGEISGSYLKDSAKDAFEFTKGMVARRIESNPVVGSALKLYRKFGGGEATGESDVDKVAAAIAMIESSGSGGYSAIGPVTRTGDRAYGKYQIMGRNIPEWSKEALGRSMTPAEFLASPEAQDVIAKKRLGRYIDKYGVSGAAAAWHGGEGGMSDLSRRDSLGTSTGEYVSRFNRHLGGAAAAAGRASDGARGGGDIKSDVSINNININAPNATDAEGISKEIGPAIKRSSIAAPANYGLV